MNSKKNRYFISSFPMEKPTESIKRYLIRYFRTAYGVILKANAYALISISKKMHCSLQTVRDAAMESGAAIIVDLKPLSKYQQNILNKMVIERIYPVKATTKITGFNPTVKASTRRKAAKAVLKLAVRKSVLKKKKQIPEQPAASTLEHELEIARLMAYNDFGARSTLYPGMSTDEAWHKAFERVRALEAKMQGEESIIIKMIEVTGFKPFQIVINVRDEDTASAFKELINSVNTANCSRKLLDLLSEITAAGAAINIVL